MTDKEAIRKLVDVIRRQHKSLATEQSYSGWLRRYMAAIYQMPTTLSSEKKLERFLTELAHKNVSAATQNQAFNAIIYFYKDVLEMPLKNVDALRANRPKHLRHAPTVQETFELLKQIKDVAGYPTRLLACMLYGCGLRVSEPLNLRIKDVRDDRLFIMGGKGQKDRVVSLPDALMAEIKGQKDFARAIWERDCKARVPIKIPEGLARKYPEYEFAWGWAWLFPSHQPCKDPRTGRIVRWRCHEANVQRAIKAARRELGIMVLPHELRHAYATHCLDRGTNIKALQEAMGHEQIDTTAGYCHADALSVKSPLAYSPPLAIGPPEPVAYSICEPEFNSSVVESFGSEIFSKAVNSELSKKGGSGGKTDDRITELVKTAFGLIDPGDKINWGGWYWNRARENASKFERVLNAVRADIKEGRVRKTSGGHFFDLWRRFAS